MKEVTIPLLVLAGGTAFTVGFCVGTRAASGMVAARERRLAAEGRALSEGWGWLRDRFGVDRLAWMAAFGGDGVSVVSDTTSGSIADLIH